MEKKNVLFVGSFKKSGKDGSLGGQMFACQTLLDSEIGNLVTWLLLDTTADSNIGASFINRARKALIRILVFIKYLAFQKVDAVLIFTAEGFSFIEKGLMVLVANSAGKKVILAPRSGVIVKDIEDSAFMRWYIPFVLKRTDIVICQSQIWKDFFYVMDQTNPEKYVVIENWIATEEYTGLKTWPKKSPKDKIQILFLAWVVKTKGIFELIEAMNIIQNRIDRSKIQLNICGNGEAYNEVIAKINAFGLEDICKLKGWTKGVEKMEMLRSNDIFVLPTYFEGYPNSLLEAMAAGLPSIATAVGSIPDIIEDGHDGFIIKPKDSKGLAEKLLILINDETLRWSFGRNAQVRVISNNSVEGTIYKFKTIFQNLNLFIEEKSPVT